ncbi:MAG: hypothetical protein GWN13_03765 [Phycisphaerae bacterium]|nr:hypothetical protein [Phycisphaerae bacterium]
MPLPRLWPKSVNEAWSFILRGAKEGLSPTEALRQYRDGGGTIRNEYWYDAYREAQIVDEIGQQILDLPDYYTVNPYLATDSPFMWRQEWVMQIEVFGEDPETQERYSRWITVESDEPLTKEEYYDMAQDVIDGTPGSIPFQIVSATDFVFYRRATNV